jgi:hypothetical protein
MTFAMAKLLETWEEVEGDRESAAVRKLDKEIRI